MIISILIRGLVMIFGYAYPAYECYKTVEKNKPETEQLRFWCQYWILVAILTVCERVGDVFISWVPMYNEAKLAFIIYLWYPKTKGAAYVYDSFFKPYVSKRENDIDRNLSELKTRVGDVTVVYWQRALSYGQTRVFDILQYIASQSVPTPQPAQSQQQVPRGRQPPARLQSQGEDLSSQPPNSSSSQPQKEPTQEAGPSRAPTEAPTNAREAIDASDISYSSMLTEHELMDIEDYEVVQLPHDGDENANTHPTTTEINMEETLASVHEGLRKRRSAKEGSVVR